MRSFRFIVLLLMEAALMTSISAAQRRAPAGSTEGKADVAVALRVGGQRYDFAGTAGCRHAPIASIYGVRAEMWTVEQSDEGRSLILTMWRPKESRGDWFSLSVSAAGKSYTVNTVTAPGAGTVKGSGNITFSLAGAGGTFTIDATAATGGAITGTIKCSAFTPATAEGGD